MKRFLSDERNYSPYSITKDIHLPNGIKRQEQQPVDASSVATSIENKRQSCNFVDNSLTSHPRYPNDRSVLSTFKKSRINHSIREIHSEDLDRPSVPGF